jgi:hypothetical protein
LKNIARTVSRMAGAVIDIAIKNFFAEALTGNIAG